MPRTSEDDKRPPKASERLSAMRWSSRVRWLNRYSPTSWISENPMTQNATTMISR